jgi:Na+-driven multidrug efflux pump
MVHLQTKSRPFSCPARRQRLTFRMLPQTQKHGAEHAYKRTTIAVRADAAQYPVQGEVTAGWKWDKAKAMLIFIGPALILPLSDPLMSLIDAICLGQVRTCSRMRAQGDIVTDKLPMVCVVTSAQATCHMCAMPSRAGLVSCMQHLQVCQSLMHVLQFAGTEQLAALGPTSLIFNFSSYVFNALGIATNTTVSSRLAKQVLLLLLLVMASMFR